MSDQELIDQDRINMLRSDLEEDFSDAYDELLSLFQDTFDQLHPKMIEQAANEDFTGLSQTSHQLKGSSANLGLATIHKLSKEIEDLCKENTSDNLTSRVDKLKEVYAKSIRAAKENI